jgi:putative AlgH/UPF0301 family transcriptional regulator
MGGPVQPEFMFVLHKGLEHYESSENAFCPIPGVYFEPDSLRIMEYCLENEAFAHEKVHDIRFYLGYSGWGVGTGRKGDPAAFVGDIEGGGRIGLSP